MSKIFTVPGEEINREWSWIGPFIEKCDPPGWDVLDVRRALIRKEAQLWASRDDEINGIWITRIENSYSHRWGVVWITAGEGLHNISLYRAHIEPWLNEQGCEFIEVSGRKGWKRLLPDYEEQGVILTKDLKNEQII